MVISTKYPAWAVKHRCHIVYLQHTLRGLYDTYNERYELREDCVTLYNDEMCHQDDAWQCAKSYEWYPDDIEWVEVDGARYHPDDAPQTESTTEGE